MSSDGPGPKIRISDPSVAHALMDLLDYVILNMAEDFVAINYDANLNTEELLTLRSWTLAWMNGEEEPVPIELFKKSSHVFASAMVVRASWNKKEPAG